jgi:hypothetical protein
MPIKKDTKSNNNIEETKSTKKNTKSEETKAPVKETKSKVKVEEITVDNSDEDEFTESEDENSDNEQTHEASYATSGDEAKKPKEKKPKESFQDLTSKLAQLTVEIKEVDGQINEIEKSLKAKEKEKTDLERQRNKIFSLLDKSHEDDIRRAQKEKPKRRGNKDGGFNKEQPVPPKLIKYLGLDSDIKMSRPKVMSLLNNKFKEDGLKEGQKTTLNKDVAKILGQKTGRTIEFTEFQSFLKELYEEAGLLEKKNTVEL